MAGRSRAVASAAGAALALLLAGLGTGAVAMFGPAPEQLVEGHAVFTVLDKPMGGGAGSTNGTVHFAAAVAVLVVAYNYSTFTTKLASRFPGVLWFNDQYLVGCSESGASKTDPCSTSSTKSTTSKKKEYPCGAVIGVNAGDPDPRPGPFDATTYNGSYQIKDPNDKVWNVDRWNLSGETAWSVSIAGADASANATGTMGCASTTGQGFEYNAVLYFDLADLHVTGKKDHSPSSPDAGDTNGCQAGATDPTGKPLYPCPANDDDREGNSHPFNPGSGYPFQNSTGRGNHGGSADCNGDGSPDFDCHATSRVDLYYGGVPAPIVRTYLLIDTQGSDAPYYCEPSIQFCDAAEFQQHVQETTGQPYPGT